MFNPALMLKRIPTLLRNVRNMRKTSYYVDKTMNVNIQTASPALASVIGTEESYSSEAIQLIWKYINANNLKVTIFRRCI